MNNIFFSSDYHFSHASILKFAKHARPFSTIDESNEAVIDAHNSVVGPSDQVYMLGDMMLPPSNDIEINKCCNLIACMNGNKTLIVGNHDRPYLENPLFVSLFNDITPDMFLKCNGVEMHLYHYPIDEWAGYYRGTWHLHGHVHAGQRQRDDKTLNVAIDASPERNLVPWSFDEVEVYMKPKKYLGEIWL